MLDGAKTGCINVLYSIALDVIAPIINPTATGINIDLTYILICDIANLLFYHFISYDLKLLLLTNFLIFHIILQFYKGIALCQIGVLMEDFNFSSNTVYENLNSLRATYPFLEVGSAGRSVLGKDIPYVRVGRGQKEVFYSAAIHANEWITSIILLEFLYEYCAAIQSNGTIWGFSARRLFETVSIYIMPIVNPDGVDLVTGSLPSNSSAYTQAQDIAENFSDIPFVEGWKANIRGVDLENLQPVCKAL